MSENELYSKEEIIQAFLGVLLTEVKETIASFSRAYYALPEKSRPVKEIEQLRDIHSIVYLSPKGNSFFGARMTF